MASIHQPTPPPLDLTGSPERLFQPGPGAALALHMVNIGATPRPTRALPKNQNFRQGKLQLCCWSNAQAALFKDVVHLQIPYTCTLHACNSNWVDLQGNHRKFAEEPSPSGYLHVHQHPHITHCGKGRDQRGLHSSRRATYPYQAGACAGTRKGWLFILLIFFS